MIIYKLVNGIILTQVVLKVKVVLVLRIMALVLFKLKLLKKMIGVI